MVNDNINSEELINNALSLKDRLAGSEFPTHILPHKMQEIIRQTNECLGFPIDFTAYAMIFAASIAIGNTHIVRFKRGWTDKVVLYLAIVGDAGMSKTHPLNFAIKPIRDSDAKSFERYKTEKKEYDQLSALSRKEREAEGILEPIMAPTLKKFLISDATPEALCKVLNNNKRGIGLVVDELKGWLNNFNRYNSGSEEQLWLSNFSCQPIIIDRSGSEPMFIAHTFTGVMGTIQDDLLKDLLKGDRKSSGFADRILFSICKNREIHSWSDIDLPSYIISMWSDILQKIIDLELRQDESGNPISTEVEFEKSARAEIFRWEREQNTALCRCEENRSMVGAYKKLATYSLRFSLIIQMIRWACGEAGKDYIDLTSVKSAIALTEYFRETMHYVRRIVNNSAALENLSSDKLTLFEQLPSEFTTKEGTKIAMELGFSQQSFNRFLAELKDNLLNNHKHGFYKKII
ncbi:MAG: DUF3987 domain-containing protein [Rikenellaceae bacterium]